MKRAMPTFGESRGLFRCAEGLFCLPLPSPRGGDKDK